jgi:enoyl-CoA hydratase
MAELYKDILVTHTTERHIAQVRLNRPRAANALTTGLLENLASALDALADADQVHAVVITGGAVLFSVGADINELTSPQHLLSEDNQRAGSYRRIFDFPKPMIAAVCGPALGGGCELAMAADIIIAGENATFGLPETKLGLIPGAGGTQRLVRAVGKSLAMHMILAGHQLTARDALDRGLVSAVVEPQNCIESAMKLAIEIAERPSEAIRYAKQSVLNAFSTNLNEGLDLEREYFVTLQRKTIETQ